jgi:Glycosyl hydrolase family 1
MTFHRGAALTTATTLGFADTADVGPTAGNGFYRRWPDDLALLQDMGITDVRLTLDWARLQRKPGDLDPDWVERFANMLEAAGAIGLRAWATLYDGSLPRWFDNEGGFGDGPAFDTWWPRWVERAAETFGGNVHGWVPFDVIPSNAAQPWRDTWGILGGEQPVVASIGGPDGLDRIGTFVGRTDRVGVSFEPVWEPDAALDDQMLDEAEDRWGTLIRVAADEVDAPAVVSGFRPSHDDHDECARIVERFVAVLDAAVADGVDVEVAFLDPAIAGHDSIHGLLDNGRSPTVTAEVYLSAD